MIYPKNIIEDFKGFRKALIFSKDLLKAITSVDLVLSALQELKGLDDVIAPLLKRIAENSLSENRVKKILVRFGFFFNL